MTLGATPWQSFYKISLPNAFPGIMAAAVISWARIFGLFGPIHLLCGTMRYKTEILPTTIYLFSKSSVEKHIRNLNPET